MYLNPKHTLRLTVILKNKIAGKANAKKYIK